jgi:ubiquinone/menaquinone biosynthesis C-methylase UbiE
MEDYGKGGIQTFVCLKISMHNNRYVHGYSSREAERLIDQAQTLTDLLHHDTRYPSGSRVLEAGCGVGAQTVTLALQSPDAMFTCIDCSAESLAEAEARVKKAGYKNATFQKADIYNPPFAPGSFDHVFVCFVLEHLPDPARALASLMTVLKPGGTITVIEGDHGLAFFHTDSRYAKEAIGCLVTLQREAGGNALIGRELFPLLSGAGFFEVVVSPRMVYVDASRPALVEGFTKQTFTAMVEGVRKKALQRGMISEPEFEQGICDLYRTCEPDGTFCYTFFKAPRRK